MSTKTNEQKVKEFVISRAFNAPRELVWKVWTEAEHIKQWLRPEGADFFAGAMDFRPGGMFYYKTRTPSGLEMWGRWTFREITPPARLVLVSSFSDEKGGVTRHPMVPTWPREMLTTTELVESNGKTTLTLRWLPINATQVEIDTFLKAFDSMTGGWSGTFQQLETYLAKAQS